MTPRRRNALGMCERRTQGARIAALFARLRTCYRAAQRVSAAGASLFSSLLKPGEEGQMENMVIERLFEKIDELRPLISRAYQTASQEERLMLDREIVSKLHDIELWVPAVSVETMFRGMRG